MNTNETYTALASAKERGTTVLVTLKGKSRGVVGVVANVDKFMSEVTMKLGRDRRAVVIIHIDQIQNIIK